MYRTRGDMAVASVVTENNGSLDEARFSNGRRPLRLIDLITGHLRDLPDIPVLSLRASLTFPATFRSGDSLSQSARQAELLSGDDVSFAERLALDRRGHSYAVRSCLQCRC